MSNYFKNVIFSTRFKRKSNNFNVEYDPNDAKKDKQKKRMRKYNRKRPKGSERILQRIAAFKAANARTNPKRDKGETEVRNE